ncbi:putative exported domain protein [Burkholderia pseudomallei]|nr:putative exported domain protein [Burkholderia pseudomallei]
MQGCQTARRLRATQSSVACVLKTAPGPKRVEGAKRRSLMRNRQRKSGRSDGEEKRVCKSKTGAEISVFFAPLQYSLQNAGALLGTEFGAFRRVSRRFGADHSNTRKKTTAKSRYPWGGNRAGPPENGGARKKGMFDACA